MAAEGGGGGGSVEIPQPLVIKGGASNYPSRDAVIAELAMRLYANTNFDIGGKSPHQATTDAIARANMFANVAGGLIDTLVPEG